MKMELLFTKEHMFDALLIYGVMAISLFFFGLFIAQYFRNLKEKRHLNERYKQYFKSL